MKVYVTYSRTPYEGCSIPDRAFNTEEEAKEYCNAQNATEWSKEYEETLSYVELEIRNWVTK